jgi:hypothetical protein
METEDQKKPEPRKRDKLSDSDKLIRDLEKGYKANWKS